MLARNHGRRDWPISTQPASRDDRIDHFNSPSTCMVDRSHSRWPCPSITRTAAPQVQHSTKLSRFDSVCAPHLGHQTLIDGAAMSCPDCFKGHTHEGTPTGQVATIHGLETYVAEPPSEDATTRPVRGIIVIVPECQRLERRQQPAAGGPLCCGRRLSGLPPGLYGWFRGAGLVDGMFLTRSSSQLT